MFLTSGLPALFLFVKSPPAHVYYLPYYILIYKRTYRDRAAMRCVSIGKHKPCPSDPREHMGGKKRCERRPALTVVEDLFAKDACPKWWMTFMRWIPAL